MNVYLQKLKNLFFYCGLEKEEYNEIKLEAYKSNFRAWKLLHILIFALFFIMTIVNIVLGFSSSTVLLSLLTLIYSGIICVLFFFVFKEDSLVAQFLIYFTMIILLCYGLNVSISKPHMMGVTFIALLLILPVFMIDKPYFMALLTSVASVIYLIFASIAKEKDVFNADLVNVVIYCFIGIIINVFINYARIHEYFYKAQESKAYNRLNGLNITLQKMSQNLIGMLGTVVESRDLESGEHIDRVKGYTYILANQVMEDCPEYGLDNYDVNLMTYASPLHDVGKISISDSILLKPGRLTDEEFEIIKTHCIKGCDIINKMAGSWSNDYIKTGLDICRSHHEKWDGKGYPQGLKGDDIPIAAQIVSIADIFDALTTKRVYKDAYSAEKAYRMIMDGECGAFSDKLLSCFEKCKEKFISCASSSDEIEIPDYDFEITSSGSHNSIVVGFHDDDRTLKEKNLLSEQLAVLSSLSNYNFYNISYVDMKENEVYKYMLCDEFSRIINNFPSDLKSNEKFDSLLNTIIVSDDYDDFRKKTERASSLEEISKNGCLNVDFRIRLEDGIHYCRMKITPDTNDKDCVLLGIFNRDESHSREIRYHQIQRELEATKEEIENREKLADRLAVINSVADEYDYVCTLNAETMAVTVYKAKPWIEDMFKNLEDIVVRPDIRNSTLKAIIHPDDFDNFKESSMHPNVLKGLASNGEYEVNYRAYKYGKLVNYQTKYTLDEDNKSRIIIGLRELPNA